MSEYVVNEEFNSKYSSANTRTINHGTINLKKKYSEDDLYLQIHVISKALETQMKLRQKYENELENTQWKEIALFETSKFLEPSKTINAFLENQKNQSKKISKLPLALSASIIVGAMGAAFLNLPSPYNFMAVLAMGGPLSASILGLKR